MKYFVGKIRLSRAESLHELALVIGNIIYMYSDEQHSDFKIESDGTINIDILSKNPKKAIIKVFDISDLISSGYSIEIPINRACMIDENDAWDWFFQLIENIQSKG